MNNFHKFWRISILLLCIANTAYSQVKFIENKIVKTNDMTFEQGVSHLTTTFNIMLYKAEEMFGERDKSWTFIGIDFQEDGPYVMYYPKNRLSIVLSTNCSYLIPSNPQLYYQLSHEICHLLYPSGKKDANVLNEGISTYFSEVYLNILFPSNKYAPENILKSKYFRAYTLVKKLLTFDPEAIKKIRAKNPSISYVTKKEIECFNFGLTGEEIEELVSKF
jgi:hypothetical protein